MKQWWLIGLLYLVGWIGGPYQHKGFYQISKAIPNDLRKLAIDSSGNRWSLEDGKVLVYPAQSPESPITISPDGTSSHLTTDSHGHVWALADQKVYVLDPRTKKPVWLHTNFKGTFLTRSSDGRALLYNGKNLENLMLSRKGILSKESSSPLPYAERFMVDRRGKTYAKTLHGNYGLEAPEDAWQRYWVEVGHLPGSNHDLSGDVLNGKFYMAGGLTAEWGFPARSKAYDTVLCFEPDSENWKLKGKLKHPRRYNATSHLDGEIWIIGGDKDKEQPPLATVEILNLQNGKVRPGPPLPAPISICTAHNVGGRLYVLGRDKDSPVTANFYSIGKEEEDWTVEKEVPEVSGPIVSTSDEENIYVVIPHKHLAIFNSKSKSWSQLSIPKPPRSCQISVHQNELWLLGGRGVAEGKETQVLNLQKMAWRNGPKLPRELVWGTAFSLNDQLYITGGAAGSCYSHRTFRLKSNAEK